MLRRAWKPVIGATVLVGGPAYIYYRYSSNSSIRETFDLSVKVQGSDGKYKRETRPMPLLSKEEVEERLHAHKQVIRTPRPGGIIWNQHTAYVASNNPIEDANASNIVQRDPSDPSAPGDLLFYAVMDGHGGFDTSRLLSKILLPAVALEYSSLIHDPKSIAPKPGYLQSLTSIISSTKAVPTHLDSDPDYVSQAIQRAFQNVDNEIIDAPLRLLAEEMSKNKEREGLPDLSQHPMALAFMKPALTGISVFLLEIHTQVLILSVLGSCALVAMFDTAHRNLYVACTGDSRAVAGVWEETGDGKGHWRVDVLTEDQTGRNPNELKRSV